MNWKTGDLAYIRKGAIPIDGPFSRECGVPTHKQEPGVMFWSTRTAPTPSAASPAVFRMKFKIGDLVVIWGIRGPEVGMIVSPPHSTDPGLSLYNVYFTNLECVAIIEDYLEKL